MVYQVIFSHLKQKIMMRTIVGPQNEDDIVFDEGTEMSSFLPIPECQQQEILGYTPTVVSTVYTYQLASSR